MTHWDDRVETIETERVRITWYVDGTNGSDANSGRLRTEAFATIGAAVTAASAGDLIRIAEDTYDEAVSVPAGLAGLEIIGDAGVIIINTLPGDCLAVAAPGCSVKNVRLTQAGQIGLLLTGADFYGEDIIADTCGAGFSLSGADARLLRCHAIVCTASGFDVNQARIHLQECWAVGSGAARGFYLGNANADNCLLVDCHTVNCTANGFDIAVGADSNMITDCSQSSLCGGPADAGANNSWVNWKIESQITAGQSVQEDLDAIYDRIGGPVAASISADIAVVDALVDTLIARTARLAPPKDQWSQLPIVALTIPAIAADIDFSDVTFPAGFLPAGAVVQSVYLMIKWRQTEDTSGGANAIDAAGKTIRVKKSGGAWGTDDQIGLTVADNQLATALNAKEGGDMIIGDNDLSGEVDDVDNETYNVRSENINAGEGITVDTASLVLRDCYAGFRVYYTLG